MQKKTSTQTLANKLTVIIPFLNEGNEVENTLCSIRDTAGDRLNIIIINDASTDNINYKLVADKYNAVYVKNKKRKGVAVSRDIGVSLIKTPYFLLLDSHMRFYQNDWPENIVEELDKNDRVLLCCNTRTLIKNKSGNIEELETPSPYGAIINLQDSQFILNSEWSHLEKEPEKEIENIACVLGAGYAASKRYWQYLHGLEELVHYGSDEPYISLKVWLEGGSCRLLKNLKIGHIYRTDPPFKLEFPDFIFNKLVIAELLLPFPNKIRIFGSLQQTDPLNFKLAFSSFLKKKKKWNELKEYYQKIFTVSFDQIIELNKKNKIKDITICDENEQKQKNIFKKALLNCNTLSSNGLWYGRMGCILFLAQYDHIRNNNYNEELIGELIDDLYSNMKKDINIDLGKGLCGIAYGIAWLFHKDLMEGDINDILEEVDNRIMERNPLRITDYSLETGLAGILYYVLYRLQIAQENNLSIPFDVEYLKHLHRASQSIIITPEKSESFEMASWFIAYFNNNSIKLEIPCLITILNLSTLKESSINPYIWGLKNGFTGLELSRLNEKISDL